MLVNPFDKDYRNAFYVVIGQNLLPCEFGKVQNLRINAKEPGEEPEAKTDDKQD